MHLEAMTLVRPVRQLRVWSRTFAHAERLAALGRERFELRAEACATAAEAVRGATIVCTTTASAVPVVESSWLAPGTHINAVGACIPTSRELASDVIRRSRLYVDRRESALAEPGDILIPLGEGVIRKDHIIAEIGELLLAGGERLRRRSADEITVFKSLGLAVEDLAAAHHVYHKARASGAGTWLALGGAHQSVLAEQPV
jgi:ornithine cyclodeaminase